MEHIDSQENAKSILISIEQKFPVDKWEVNGIDVWPYIRIKLYYALLTSGNAPNNNPKKMSEKAT